ncbi:MAG: aminotransferase class IV [Deinococcota bacterium]
MSHFHSINGNFVAEADATIHASDITFRRGFGAFDYLRLYEGVPLFMEDHLARFERTAEILGIDMLMSRSALTEHVLELIAKNGQETAGLQLFLTGGYAEDGFTPTTPNLVILQNPLPHVPQEKYDQGAKLISHEYTRDLPEAKTTNYMMAVVLGKTMRAAGATDALYYSSDTIFETTRSNFFVVDADGAIITPREGILYGITRKHILQVAHEHATVVERRLTWDDLKNAKEAFITSTTKGALPIVQIDDMKVGSGVPGEVAKTLMTHFEAHRQAYLEEFRNKYNAVAS